MDPDQVTSTQNGSVPFTIGRVVHAKYDSLGRSTGFTLRENFLVTSTLHAETTYRYSATNGRFGAVTSNPIGAGYTATHDFLYGYETDSNLHKTTQSFTNYNFSTNTGTAIHQATRTYFADRDALDVISNTNSSTNAVISGSDYAVNAIGQRTGITRSGSATPASASAAYAYNNRGELTAADEATNAMDRAFQYDGIGNREKSADSLTLPGTNNYTVNALNQYSQITNNSITINPSHDDDGNATAYPLPVNPAANAALTYDGENRLIKVITGSTTVEYIYDAFSRRVAKTVGSTRTYYIYDGWNCVAEYTGTVHTTGAAPALTRTYTHTWGLDLSGSQQGAGGVGGLLMSSKFTSATTATAYYPCFDGNGNIIAYINSSCTVEASFDYDPFGNIANSNNTPALPYAFSTKPREAETGLYYYGYRWYDPITGRWPSRDPIGERGGVNLYGFVSNNALLYVELLGLFFGSTRADELSGNINIQRNRGENITPEQEAEIIKAGFKGHEDFSNIVGCSKYDHYWSKWHFTYTYTDKHNKKITTYSQHKKTGDFNYRFEDDAYPAGGANTHWHFQPLEKSRDQVKKAACECNVREFSRAMHRLQDFWAHYNKGYTGGHATQILNNLRKPDIKPGDGSGGRGRWPDGRNGNLTPDLDNSAWEQAEEETKRMLDYWRQHCVMKIERKWSKCWYGVHSCKWVKRTPGPCVN